MERCAGAIDILWFRGAVMSRGGAAAVNLLRCPAVASVIDEMAGSDEGPFPGPAHDMTTTCRRTLALGRSLSRPL